jgi:phosphoglycerate dehydrogenase-like enzyme
MAMPNLPADVIVTSGRGIHGPQMAEMAFLYMIALSRDFPRMLANQKRAVWERWPQRLLLGKKAVLLGVGSISEEVAARCKAFGMRTVGISSGRSEAPGFDMVLPRTALQDAVADADFLIVLVPLSPETRHMVSQDVIAALPAHAILINLARGDVVDEAALIAALQAKRIAGAGLDVFAVEPPVPDNPLWQLENVIMTPRVGGMSDVYRQQVLPVLLDNLRAYSTGQRGLMRNLVRG